MRKMTGLSMRWVIGKCPGSFSTVNPSMGKTASTNFSGDWFTQQYALFVGDIDRDSDTRYAADTA